MAPICAHSLSFRPIILPAMTEIIIKLPDQSRSPATVYCDGKNYGLFEKGDILKISMSKLKT